MSLPKNDDRCDSIDDLELGVQEIALPTSQLRLIAPPPLYSIDGIDECSQVDITTYPAHRHPAGDVEHSHQKCTAGKRPPKTLIMILKIAVYIALFGLNVACVTRLIEVTHGGERVDPAEAAGLIGVEFCLLFFPLTPVIFIGVKAATFGESTHQRIGILVITLLFLGMAIGLPFGLLWDRLYLH